MSRPPLGFRRLVLDLRSAAASPATTLALEFADLLDADLVGLFIEDRGLGHLAEMPFAREFRAASGDWRALEPQRLRRELDRAATEAERRFTEAARGRKRREFRVLRPTGADLPDTVARADDLVVIGVPGAADRVAEPFASLLAAALRSNAGVLLAPSRRASAGGPITAIASGPDDPSLAAAKAIAAAEGRRLVVVAPQAAATSLRAGGPSGGERARLVVATRGALDIEITLAIVGSRGVPVLSIRSQAE